MTPRVVEEHYQHANLEFFGMKGRSILLGDMDQEENETDVKKSGKKDSVINTPANIGSKEIETESLISLI